MLSTLEANGADSNQSAFISWSNHCQPKEIGLSILQNINIGFRKTKDLREIKI